jgi:hypothetical protein
MPNIHVVLLEGRGLVVGTKDLVEEGKGASGPDHKPAKVTTGCELEDVEVANVDSLDTGDVAEGLDETLVLVVDDQGSSSLTVATVTQLALSGTELAGVGDLLDVVVGVESLEGSDGGLGPRDTLDGVSDDEGNLLDLLDTVTAGEDEGGEGRGGQGRDGSESLLVQVGLDVPLAPDLGGSEHATATAHVTERSLGKHRRSEFRQ